MTDDENDLDTEPVYYYSREHRLKRASKTVREFNESAGTKAGVIRSIAGNKGNIFLLVSILLVCVMFILGSRSREQSGLKLGGNSIELSFVKAEPGGGLSLALRKTVPGGEEAYAGAVEVVISPVQSKPAPGEENPPPEIARERFFFSLTEEEVFLLPLPFQGDEFIVMLRAGEETGEETIVRRVRPPKE